MCAALPFYTFQGGQARETQVHLTTFRFHDFCFPEVKEEEFRFTLSLLIETTCAHAAKRGLRLPFIGTKKTGVHSLLSAGVPTLIGYSRYPVLPARTLGFLPSLHKIPPSHSGWDNDYVPAYNLLRGHCVHANEMLSGVREPAVNQCLCPPMYARAFVFLIFLLRPAYTRGIFIFSTCFFSSSVYVRRDVAHFKCYFVLQTIGGFSL